jgi:hypothetical protein
MEISPGSSGERALLRTVRPPRRATGRKAMIVKSAVNPSLDCRMSWIGSCFGLDRSLLQRPENRRSPQRDNGPRQWRSTTISPSLTMPSRPPVPSSDSAVGIEYRSRCAGHPLRAKNWSNAEALSSSPLTGRMPQYRSAGKTRLLGPAVRGKNETFGLHRGRVVLAERWLASEGANRAGHGTRADGLVERAVQSCFCMKASNAWA